MCMKALVKSECGRTLLGVLLIFVFDFFLGCGVLPALVRCACGCQPANMDEVFADPFVFGGG